MQPLTQELSKYFNNLLLSQIQQTNQQDVQFLLAARLRALAIKHLETSSEVVATNFRGGFLTGEKSTTHAYQQFLRDQEQNGAWGTYVEATALGEAFNCNVVVTPIKNGKKQQPICLYKSENNTVPTLHLYNNNNTHWQFHENNNTAGDGNCLYNAFAQAIQQVVCCEKGVTVKVKPTVNVSSAFFNHHPVNEDARIIQQQEALITSAVSKASKPSQLKNDSLFHEARIKKLSQHEQDQIKGDYELALKLAREEMASFGLR